MKNLNVLTIAILALLVTISGCVKKQETTPEKVEPLQIQEKVVEVVKTETVEVPVYECDWVKPILISDATAKVLKDHITPDVEADVAKIYKHNAQYEVACSEAEKK